MKKIRIFAIFIFTCLLLTGCGKMSEKEIKKTKDDMINHIKTHMYAGWSYSEEKVKIDDDLNVEIKMYNIVDSSECALETREAFTSLKKDLDEKSYLKKITIYCEYKDEKVSRATTEDIKKLNIDNYYSEIEFYDGSNNKVTINDDWFNKQKENFIEKCQKFSYKEIFRNSDQYVSQYATFTGEVQQVMDSDPFFEIRINVTKDEWGYYSDTIYVLIPKEYFSGRILENDIITIYGRLNDLVSYESIFGQTITIPALYARYTELIK